MLFICITLEITKRDYKLQKEITGYKITKENTAIKNRC